MESGPDTLLAPEDSDATEDAVIAATATLSPGWILLHDCPLAAGRQGEDAALLRHVLLHPDAGIVLLDVLPGPETPDAADRLRRKLEAGGFVAEFGGLPPVVHLALPLRLLSDLAQSISWGLRGQPRPALRGGVPWTEAAQEILKADPRQLATEAVGLVPPPPPHGASAGGARGMRRLAWFWAGVLLVLGGGAAMLHHLGPPETSLAAASDGRREPEARPAGVPAPSLLAAAAASGQPEGRRAPGGVLPVVATDGSAETALPDSPPHAFPGTVPEISLGIPPGASPGAGTAAGDLAPAAALAVRTGTDAEVLAPPAPLPLGLSPNAGGASVAAAIVPTPSPAAEPAARQRPQADRPPPAAIATSRRRPVGTDWEGGPQEEPMRTAVAGASAEIPVPPPDASVLPEEPAGAHPPSPVKAVASRPPQERQPPAVAASPPPMDLAAAAAGTAGPDDGTATAAPQPFPPGRDDAGPGDPAPPLAPQWMAARRDHAMAATPGMSPALRDSLIRRGDSLAALGDISAARLLYERAATAGSGRAAAALGRTFDPVVLTGMGVRGIPGDREAAIAWYRRAIALGHEEARDWLAVHGVAAVDD